MKKIKLIIDNHYDRVEMGNILKSNNYDAWIESVNDEDKTVRVCLCVPEEDIEDTIL